HHLPRAAREAATQPVVHDQESRRAPGAPPLRAALDDRDRTLRHAHREIDDAPVAGDAGRAAGELTVDRQRIAAGVATVEALEEHRVLEPSRPGRITALESVLALPRVVGGVDRRADAQGPPVQLRAQ